MRVLKRVVLLLLACGPLLAAVSGAAAQPSGATQPVEVVVLLDGAPLAEAAPGPRAAADRAALGTGEERARPMREARALLVDAARIYDRTPALAEAAGRVRGFGGGADWMALALAVLRGSDVPPPAPLAVVRGSDAPPPAPLALVRGIDAPPPAPLAVVRGIDALPPAPLAVLRGSDALPPALAVLRGSDALPPALAHVRGIDAPPPAPLGHWGAIKYGAASLSASLFLALAFALSAPPLALLAIFAFYAIEAQMVFLFPAALDGAPSPLLASRRFTVRAGGTRRVMQIVMPIAATMIFGGCWGRGFVRSWCIGCLAVCIWYERLRASS
jgi:hypothetical protein